MADRTRTNPFDDVRWYMDLVAKALGPAAAQKILKDNGGGVSDPDNLRESLCPAVVLALKSALGESERQKELRRENRWQLSSDHLQFIEATDALDVAWQHARTLATREEALEYMRKQLDKYKDVGATSSRTHGELYALLHEQFPA
jgi:hypothetical protein